MIDISYLPEGGTGHMIVSPESLAFWHDVKNRTGFKTLFEIGFNAGHSSSMILEMFDDVSIVSIDIGQFDITETNAKIVKKRFPGRFEYRETDSLNLNPGDIKADILFIDGSHDYPYVSSDFALALASKVPYIILDDLQNRNVKRVLDENRHLVDVVCEGQYPASTGKRIPVKCLKTKS